MKLANALSERSDLLKRLGELSKRLEDNVKVQEGEKPTENPYKLVGELNGCLDRYEYLVLHINLTNNQTIVEGKTLTELLAHREYLTRKMNIYHGMLKSARESFDRYSLKEIKIVPTVSVEDLQKQLDLFSKEYRLCDDQIQALNWATDLLE